MKLRKILAVIVTLMCSLALPSCVRESAPEPEIKVEAIAEEPISLVLPDFEAIHGTDRLNDIDGSYLAGSTDPFLVKNIDVEDPSRLVLQESKLDRENLEVHIKEVVEWRLLGLFETPEGIPSQPKPTVSFLGSVYNDADYDPSTGNVFLVSEGGSRLIVSYTKYKLADSK